jgi:hypothetical protein
MVNYFDTLDRNSVIDFATVVDFNITNVEAIEYFGFALKISYQADVGIK